MVKRGILTLGLLLLLILALTACGAEPTQAPAAPAEEPAAAAAPEEPAAEEAAPAEEEAPAEAEAGDDLLAEIQSRGTIKVSTDANYAPQSFMESDGTFVGFDIDVATEIAKRLGVEAEFVTPDWDIITAGNWGGQWDMSVGSMTITTARQEVLHFADPPYYYTPAQFAASESSGVESLEDIAGQTVCVGVSTTYESWLNGDMEALGLPQESVYAEAPQ